MLDVIGAGATATSAQDWDAIWRGSSEAARTQDEIDAYYAEGRNRPAVTADLHSEFATPWLYQVKELFIREASSYWRDPTYLIAAKIALDVLAGLFVGFTFYQSKDTQQGTQNKLFVSFSSFLSPCQC
jgi:ATP-binding cassette subfamily G (WHITE) protein 2 (SNQ2)